MCEKEKDFCDDYGFRFLEHADEPAIQLDAVGWQRRNSGEYYWDNQNRQECFLFQYTLSGSGTLKTEEGTFVLKKGEAFFVQVLPFSPEPLPTVMHRQAYLPPPWSCLSFVRLQ